MKILKAITIILNTNTQMHFASWTYDIRFFITTIFASHNSSALVDFWKVCIRVIEPNRYGWHFFRFVPFFGGVFPVSSNDCCLVRFGLFIFFLSLCESLFECDRICWDASSGIWPIRKLLCWVKLNVWIFVALFSFLHLTEIMKKGKFSTNVIVLQLWVMRLKWMSFKIYSKTW